MKKLFSPLNLVLALALTLFIIAAAVVVTLNFRPLYYLDVDLLNIPASSGLPKEEVLANYNALIDYNALFGPQTLEFPTLAMSETGRIHFEEVKDVFVFFEVLAIVCGLLSAAGIVYRHFRKNPGYLLLTGILTVALPVVLGILIALNWQTVFVLFHRIVFNNNYWIFDPATDPVITILPDTFFMHCALLILALVVLGSVVCLLVYRHRKILLNAVSGGFAFRKCSDQSTDAALRPENASGVPRHDQAVVQDAVLLLALRHDAAIVKAALAVAGDRPGIVRFRIDQQHVGAVRREKRRGEQVQHPRAEPAVAAVDLADVHIDAVGRFARPHRAVPFRLRDFIVRRVFHFHKLHVADRPAVPLHDAGHDMLGQAFPVFRLHARQIIDFRHALPETHRFRVGHPAQHLLEIGRHGLHFPDQKAVRLRNLLHSVSSRLPRRRAPARAVFFIPSKNYQAKTGGKTRPFLIL